MRRVGSEGTHMMRHLGNILALFVTLMATAWAQTTPSAQEIRTIQTRASAGDAAAQVELGRMYLDGRGVPPDASQGAMWLGKAAEQAHPYAQYILGVLYSQGSSVPKDERKALSWFSKAATQGNVSAQVFLGGIYANGTLGVTKNAITAYVWWSAASVGANAAKDAELAALVTKQRDTLATTMTAAQIAEANKLAKQWQALFDSRKQQ
jgi:TPR repeat protein